MGRAMLIICSAVLISMGYIGIGSSNQGRMLNEKVVNYADFTMAKNAAHTAIQIAMQKTNSDDEWPNNHNSKDNAWITTIQGIDIVLYADYNQDGDYWKPDSLRFYSYAEHRGDVVEVISFFEKAPFSTLVPDFEGALTFAADPDNYTFSAGGSASISGNSQSACNEDQESSMPGIAVQPGSEDKLSDLENITVDADPKYEVKEDLSYQPTDELIARLSNSPNATTLAGTVNYELGSASNPGVFFVEDYLKLNGQTEGYGILVIRSDAVMEYEGDLHMNGAFQWNGLIIFEDAYNFKGNGTPKVNGSILVGHTEDYDGQPIEIDISGDIDFQYDCMGEDYAKQAAALAIEQNKYSRIVTRENVKYISSSNEEQTLLDKVKNLL